MECQAENQKDHSIVVPYSDMRSGGYSSKDDEGWQEMEQVVFAYGGWEEMVLRRVDKDGNLGIETRMGDQGIERRIGFGKDERKDGREVFSALCGFLGIGIFGSGRKQEP